MGSDAAECRGGTISVGSDAALCLGGTIRVGSDAAEEARGGTIMVGADESVCFGGTIIVGSDAALCRGGTTIAGACDEETFTGLLAELPDVLLAEPPRVTTIVGSDARLRGGTIRVGSWELSAAAAPASDRVELR